MNDMPYPLVNISSNFSIVLLAISPALTGIIIAIVALITGATIWYFVRQNQLKTTRQQAVKTLQHLQQKLAGLNEALIYLNKYPEIINIEDNIHASDISQLISEYLHFTEANILGDSSIDKAPMSQKEAQEFIDRVKNNLAIVAPMASNNVLLVEGIKTLDVLQEKKNAFAKQLPQIEQQISALISTNTDWWHEQTSFTRFDDFRHLYTEIDQGIVKGWEFLKKSGSTKSEAQGIRAINQELNEVWVSFEQMVYEAAQLKKTIGAYQTRLAQAPQQIQHLNEEIAQWQKRYAYINKSRELKQVKDHEQQVKKLAATEKKDWKSLMHHITLALQILQQVKDYFIGFDQARINYEHKLEHTIHSLDTAIHQWQQKPTYTHLPNFNKYNQYIKGTKGGLDSLLAKKPAVDWLMAEETAQELITHQKGLIIEFENYKAAHEKFMQLTTEIQHIHSNVAQLELEVRLKTHEMLPGIDQAQVELSKAQDWFEKAITATTLVKLLKAYAQDLREKQQVIYQFADKANEALATVQELLQHPMITSKHRALIDELSVPPIRGLVFEQLIPALDQACQQIDRVQLQIKKDFINQEEEQKHLTYLQTTCHQAIERARLLHNRVSEELKTAICLLEMPDTEDHAYDEAIQELEAVRRRAIDLYNKSQRFLAQQGG
ncbi:hypothetical protein [uncultured Microscilla sp.]|uniref:hypothetical protein n=1 Tax=uncultured Microscilla sp. TaxID=432653 RepID=UPI002628C14D|nr:hypothetical protein [uncultured Microscilla sp.]